MDCQNALKALYLWTYRAAVPVLLGLALLGSTSATLAAAETSEDVTQESGDAEWIWSPAHTKNEMPVGGCFFLQVIRFDKTRRRRNPNRGRQSV